MLQALARGSFGCVTSWQMEMAGKHVRRKDHFTKTDSKRQMQGADPEFYNN
jgi:hypothetical protein